MISTFHLKAFMNLLLIIAALFIVTETINPEVDDAKKIQKNEAIVETVETKPSEEIISEAQAAAVKATANAVDNVWGLRW